MFIYSTLFSQEPNEDNLADSLYQLIVSPESYDTTKVSAYIELGELVNLKDLDSAIKLTHEAIELIKNALLNVNEEPVELSLNRKWAVANINLGGAYSRLSQDSLSLFFYDDGLRMAKKIGDKQCEAVALYRIGGMNMQTGYLDSALVDFERSLNICMEIKDKFHMANVLNLMGLTYKQQGNVEAALEYYHKSLKIKQEVGRKQDIATAFNNIGVIHFRQGNDSLALYYMKQALKLSEQSGDLYRLQSDLSNIGMVYSEYGDHISALEYMEKSLKICKKIENLRGICTNLNNIGLIYKRLNNFQKALEYYGRSMKVREEEGINDQKAMAISIANIASIYLDQGKLDQAEKYCSRSLEIAQKIGTPRYIRNAAQGLYKINKKKGNGTKALQMYKLYLQMRDSIDNEGTQKVAIEKQKEYELEKKDKELKILAKEKKIKEVKLQQVQQARNGLILGIAIFLIMLTVIGMIYRQRQKVSKIAHLKTEELKKQKARMSGQEEERKRIAKELYDGLENKLFAIKSDLGSINKKEKDKNIDHIISDIGLAHNEATNISQNLISNALDGLDFVDAIKNYIKKSVKPEQLKFVFEHSDEEELNHLPYHIQLDIYRIIQELLNNIVKHAKAKEVVVNLSKKDEEVDLLIKDDGIGFDIDKEVDGIGLKNVKSRLGSLGGDLNIKSLTNKGTCFHIQFSLKEEVINTL